MSEQRIERRTASGGRLAFADPPAGAIVTCGACGSIRDDARRPVMLAVQTPVAGRDAPLTLDTSICADCLGEALAILFARRALQRGETTPEDLGDASQLEHRGDA